MRIALISEFFYPTLGGVQEHLFNAAYQYTAKGHTVRIVTPRVFTRVPFEKWWPKRLPREVYQPVGRSLPFFINDSRGRLCVGLNLGSQLKQLLTPENFDIVHLHAPLNGTLPIIAAHYSSTYTVGTFHTSFPGSGSLKLFQKPAQRQIDKLNKIIGVSPISIESISRYFKLEAEIIPNGVDTEYFKPRWQTGLPKHPALDDDRLNILYVGRPDPRNGLDTLISAFGRVVQRFSRIRLVVVGGGPDMKRYQDMAQFLPAGSVVFMGAIRDERDVMYRSADIHVFGVEKATHSITIMEGMAAGLPILTTPFTGHESLGVAGRHFLTTPFADVPALEEALAFLITHPEERERLSRAARQQALTFDWSVVAERLLNLYREVIGQSASESVASIMK